MINKVEICGVNTSKLPVLTNKEKDELFIKIKNAPKSLITEITKSSGPWCKSSVISNKSLVTLESNSPTFLSSKNEKDNFW